MTDLKDFGIFFVTWIAIQYWSWQGRYQNIITFWGYASWAFQEEELSPKKSVLLPALANYHPWSWCFAEDSLYMHHLLIFLGISSTKSIKINTCNTSRTLSLTPYKLSTIAMKHRNILIYMHICTAYSRVEHSPPLLYYELFVQIYALAHNLEQCSFRFLRIHTCKDNKYNYEYDLRMEFIILCYKWFV